MLPATEIFSLTEGGPFYRLATRLHLRMARAWWLGIVLWLPIVVGEGVRRILGGAADPMLYDLSLHVRLLFSLPVFLLSEPLLDQTVKSALTSLYKGSFCDPVRIDPIVDRAGHLRSSGRIELALLVVAVVGGQLVMWKFMGATGLFHGGTTVWFWSFPRLWYALVALPLVLFVMFRWFWRWLVWSYMVVRIARLPLFLLATHADLAGGLSGLARPITGFSGFVLAIAAILSGAWSTQLLERRTTMEGLLPMLVVFLVTSLAVAVGPLLLLCGHLFRARRRTLAQYGDFMRRYALEFHAKWIEGSRVEEPLVEDPLGSSDIQSLADLGNAYHVAARSRVFVFGSRNIFTVWAAGLLPMLPLVLSTLTFEQVLRRIASTVLGGLPL